MKFKVTKHKVVKIGGKPKFLMCFSYYIADGSGEELRHHYRQLFMQLQPNKQICREVIGQTTLGGPFQPQILWIRVFFRTEGEVKKGNQELQTRCTTYLVLQSFQKGKEFQNTYCIPQKHGQRWTGEGSINLGMVHQWNMSNHDYSRNIQGYATRLEHHLAKSPLSTLPHFLS